MYIPHEFRQKPKLYSLGEYIIAPHCEVKNQIAAWIVGLRFLDCETADRKLSAHTRKANCLYEIQLDSYEAPLILKVVQPSNHRNWRRRLNSMLTRLFRNPNLSSFHCSLGFEQNNIASIKPIAYWTYQVPGQSEKSYLLYEKVQAEMSAWHLGEYLVETNPQANIIIEEITHQLAQVVRDIHAANMRHGDPHSGNFLVSLNGKDISTLTKGQISQLTFTLIDLDKSHFVRVRWKWLKYFFDMKCLRRFRIRELRGTPLLPYYLQREPNKTDLLVMKFWMRGGFNLYKHLHHKNRVV